MNGFSGEFSFGTVNHLFDDTTTSVSIKSWKIFRLDTCHLQCVERCTVYIFSILHSRRLGDLDVAAAATSSMHDGELPIDAAAKRHRFNYFVKFFYLLHNAQYATVICVCIDIE